MTKQDAFRIGRPQTMSTSIPAFDHLERARLRVSGTIDPKSSPEYPVHSDMSHDGFAAVRIENVELFGNAISEDSESNVIGTTLPTPSSSIDAGSLIPRDNSLSRETSSLVEMIFDSHLLESSALENIPGNADVLPCYSSTVHCSGVMNRKIEYHSPEIRAERRCWTKVYLLLRGTSLTVYPFGSARKVTGRPLLNPVQQYTLQYAEVGIASDYINRTFVLRVRAEGQQFLLQCSTEAERIQWVENIQSSANIALALDDRRIPEDNTCTYRRVRSLEWERLISPEFTREGILIQYNPSQLSLSRIHLPVINCPEGDVLRNGTSNPPSSRKVLREKHSLPRIPHQNRILMPILDFKQERQAGWVIINGVQHKIDCKTGMFKSPDQQVLAVPKGENSTMVLDQLKRYMKFFVCLNPWIR